MSKEPKYHWKCDQEEKTKLKTDTFVVEHCTCLEGILDESVGGECPRNITYYSVYFILTLLFGVSLKPFRDKLFAHIFKTNLLPKLSTHGHGAAPKLTLCSVALPSSPHPCQSCNHSYFWHHQESLSPFLCSPVEGHEVSYSPWTEYFRGQQPGPGKPPELLVSTWHAATAAISGLLGERTTKDVSF